MPRNAKGSYYPRSRDRNGKLVPLPRPPDPLDNLQRQLTESALFKATYDPDGANFALAETDLAAFNEWADVVYAEAKETGKFKAFFYMLSR